MRSSPSPRHSVDGRVAASAARADRRRAQWSGRLARAVVVAIFALTVGQLAVATFAPGLPQFEGKAFGARLLFYPCMMAVVPVGWWLSSRRRGGSGAPPWRAFAS